MLKNKYIVRGNSSGKTRELLELAKQQNAVVVCKNASAMARKAEAYGIFGLNFISYDEIMYANNVYDREEWIDGPFVVDEVCDFISTFFENQCVGFTQTEE